MSYKCSYCKGEFKDPRLLDCYHTFCRSCLDDYLIKNYENGKFSCPMCKEYQTVPINGARGLTKNTFVNLQEDDCIYCNICDRRVRADSACRNCNVYLCKSCLLTHISTQGDHSVMRLDNYGSKAEKRCKDHRNEVYELFCDTCEKPMCALCNLTGHSLHDIRDIGSKASLLRRQLETETQELKTKSMTKIVKDEMENRQSKMRIYHEDKISTIEERAKELHTMVAEVRKELISKVMKENIDEIEKSEYDERITNTKIASVEELVKFCYNFVENAYDIDVVSHSPKIKKQIKRLRQNDFAIDEMRKKHFHAFDAERTHLEIQKMFGNFEISNKRPSHIKSISSLSNLHRTPYHSASRKKRFSCSDGIVTGLSVTPDGLICVCIGNEGILEIYTHTGRMNERFKFGISIDDVVSNRRGILFVSSNFNKKIFKIERSRKEVFAETQTCIRGLAMDSDGSLIAGMTVKGSFFDTQENGFVTKISMENKKKIIIEDYKLRYPARIDVIGDLRKVVSDWIKGYVLIFWKDKIMDIYTGGGRTSKDFTPRGVCTLSNGDIVIVDISLNRLHWVSSEGELRDLVKVEDGGDLWSVTADKDDTVWVGTQDGQVIPVNLL